MVRRANDERGIEAVLNYVAIPADAPKKTTNEMFDKEYMLTLEELGRQMGADPSSWSDEIPSAYGIQDTWLDED